MKSDSVQVELPAEKQESNWKDRQQSYSIIELPYTNVYETRVEGDNLFMSANVSPSNSGDIIKCQIDMYNMTTKETKTIYKSPLEICYQSLMVNKNWILWSDRGNGFSDSKVYARNRQTEKDKLITKPDESSWIIPFLYEDYAAWINDTERNVMLYNLKTDELKKIWKLNEIGPFYVYMADDMLLWTDCIEEKGYYILYDLNTGRITKYEAPCKYPGYAEMAQNKIYSLNFKDDYHDWSLNRLGVFDIATKTYHQLSDSYINALRVGNNSIAVLDQGSRLKLYINHKNIKEIPITLPYSSINAMDYSEDGRLIVNVSQNDGKSTLILLEPDKY